jgi:hypothetical protein
MQIFLASVNENNLATLKLSTEHAALLNNAKKLAIINL